jgi:hypothetical protein
MRTRVPELQVDIDRRSSSSWLHPPKLWSLRQTLGGSLGYDRMLKTNTDKRRVHSLTRQGSMPYETADQRLLSNAAGAATLTDVFGLI